MRVSIDDVLYTSLTSVVAIATSVGGEKRDGGEEEGRRHGVSTSARSLIEAAVTLGESITYTLVSI